MKVKEQRDRNPDLLSDGAKVVLSDDHRRLWLIRQEGAQWVRYLLSIGPRSAGAGVMVDRDIDGTVLNFIVADYASSDDVKQLAREHQRFRTEAEALVAL